MNTLIVKVNVNAARRIKLLKQRFATPDEGFVYYNLESPALGFAYNSRKIGRAWTSSWEELYRAIKEQVIG